MTGDPATATIIPNHPQQTSRLVSNIPGQPQIGSHFSRGEPGLWRATDGPGLPWAVPAATPKAAAPAAAPTAKTIIL